MQEGSRNVLCVKMEIFFFPLAGKKILQTEISLENFSLKKCWEIWASGSISACRLHLKSERKIKNWMIYILANSKLHVWSPVYIYSSCWPALTFLWIRSIVHKPHEIDKTPRVDYGISISSKSYSTEMSFKYNFISLFSTKGKNCFASSNHWCQDSGCFLAWN